MARPSKSLHTLSTSPYLLAVAGLKMHIPAAELQGRLAVAILNLKPAKLAGMTSEAMLLAADAPKGDGDELVRVLTPPGMSRWRQSLLHICPISCLIQNPLILDGNTGASV